MLAFQADPKAHQDRFAEALLLLARHIVQGFKFKGIEPDDTVQECVLLGMSKAYRFDPARGKAFNFFTTLMLNQCRHLYRTRMSHEEMRLRYYKILAADDRRRGRLGRRPPLSG